MSGDQQDEQDLLPDTADERDADGDAERDEGVEDESKVGIGSDVISGDNQPDDPDLDAEGIEGK